MTCVLLWSTHVAVGRKLEFLTLWPSSQGCSGVLTTWQLASPRASESRERAQDGSYDVFCDLVSEVVHHHFFSSKKQVTKSCSCSRGGELSCTF